MSNLPVWSLYEGVISIWEQDPLTGLKVNPGTPLVVPRLVTGLALNPSVETVDILQPGADPTDHYGLEEYDLSIENFFQDKASQFATAPLFNRVSSVDADYSRRFIIEVNYSNKREHPSDDLEIFKQCYSRLPSFSASQSPAALTGKSMDFRVLEWA